MSEVKTFADKLKKYIDFVSNNISTRYSNTLVAIILVTILACHTMFSIYIGINILSFGYISDFVIIIILVLGILFLFPSITTKVLYIVFCGFMIFIYNIDLIYYNYYKKLASILDLRALKWLNNDYGINLSIIGVIIGVLLVVSVFILFKNHYLKPYKINKIVRISTLSIFTIFFILAAGNNIIMMFRPSFDSVLEYQMSTYALYDSMSDGILFSQHWGFYFYHSVEALRGIF